jgi:hypothetical protein
LIIPDRSDRFEPDYEKDVPRIWDGAVELFDLNALAEAMSADRRYKELPAAIRQASSMSSIKNDLGRADEMLGVSKRMQGEARRKAERGKHVDRGEAATIQALFAQAVLLYTRAVHSSGSGRNKLQIANFLPEELRETHDRITGLRDAYFAHFAEPGEWERHRVVLALDIEQTQMALSYPHESYYVRAEEAQDFETLLRAARDISERAYVRASERLNLLLNRLFEEDPQLLSQLRAHPFSPKTFFDPDEVDAYRAAIGRLETDPVTSPRVKVPRAAGSPVPTSRRGGR